MSVLVLRCGAELGILAVFKKAINSGRPLVRFLAFMALFPLILMAPGSGASAEDWIVKRVSGIVYFVAPNVDAFRARKGMVFEKGYTLGTRSGARALIVRGSETITVGPNTTFALSGYRSNSTQTTLLHRKGRIEVDVNKRQRQHFVVETPFLAAVVKGTRFDVSVQRKKARVSVQRGLVEVEDFASGDRADLRAGQNASSAPEQKVGLSVGGKTKPIIRPGTKRAPAFETPAVKNVPASSTVSGSSSGGFSFFGNSSNGNVNGNSGNSGNDNGNSNGNSGNSGNGNGNANGNGNGNSNGNSGNSGNGNANGNSGNSGNGNGNSNGNSGNSGNGNGNANGNSGNSGNGNGNSNGNSGNSGNGNGNANGNSGNSGNGNGNSNGNSSNSNSNGNGNGNN